MFGNEAKICGLFRKMKNDANKTRKTTSANDLRIVYIMLYYIISFRVPLFCSKIFDGSARITAVVGVATVRYLIDHSSLLTGLTLPTSTSPETLHTILHRVLASSIGRTAREVLLASCTESFFTPKHLKPTSRPQFLTSTVISFHPASVVGTVYPTTGTLLKTKKRTESPLKTKKKLSV